MTLGGQPAAANGVSGGGGEADGNGHAAAQPVVGAGLEERFLKGVAVSVWQNSGDAGSNWTRFAKGRWPFSWLGVSAVRGKYNIDTCSDFWNKLSRPWGFLLAACVWQWWSLASRAHTHGMS